MIASMIIGNDACAKIKIIIYAFDRLDLSSIEIFILDLKKMN